MSPTGKSPIVPFSSRLIYRLCGEKSLLLPQNLEVEQVPAHTSKRYLWTVARISKLFGVFAPAQKLIKKVRLKSNNLGRFEKFV